MSVATPLLITVTQSWNSWEGGIAKQVTDDAYVRSDLTPLSTKIAGIVRALYVSDYQQVHKGDLLVELQDIDYQAQVDQAKAAVAATKIRTTKIPISWPRRRSHISKGCRSSPASASKPQTPPYWASRAMPLTGRDGSSEPLDSWFLGQ